MTCDKAMKVIEEEQKRKCVKKMEGTVNAQEVEDMLRKLDAKSKDVLKVKQDLAENMDQMRKDCNKRKKTMEMKGLQSDFKATEGAMGKLIKNGESEGDANQAIKDELVEKNCELGHLKNKKAGMDKCGCNGTNMFGCCNADKNGKDCGSSCERET